MKPSDNFGICDLAGTSFQHFLTTAGDGHQAAFAGTLCLKIKILKQGGKLSCQKVLQCDPGAVFGIIGCRKAGILMGNLYMKTRGRCKGVSLYMVNREYKAAEMISAC